MTLGEAIRLEAEKHPYMQPQDVLKFLYQATFGAEHLLLEEEKAWEYFRKEFDETKSSNEVLANPVGTCYVRVHLGTWKKLGLPPEWLFRMFYLTASEKTVGTEELFMEGIEEVSTLLEEGVFSFSVEEWKEAWQEYQEGGVRAVHHSQRYRQLARPSYRLIHQKYLRIFPVILKLAKLSNNCEVKVLALDGRAASGKSTVAEQLSLILNAGIVHMDDFFLPLELRTKERLSEAGGNVHYERFIEEVLPYIKKTNKFTYRRFDCGKMAYGEERIVPESEWKIVEGSYSCHPKLGDYMDLRLFCDVTEEEQMERIRKRNGEKMAEIFQTRWIPMEEHYFQERKIREKAEAII